MKNKISKIISVICAIAMIFSSMAAVGSVSAVESGASIDLQSAANAIEVTNDTTEDTLLASLQALELDGYTVTAIADFYKIKAIEGAIEKGSAYEGAVDGEILVPGEKGYVSAVVTLSDGSTATVILTIEPTMAEYSFASVSNTMDDWKWSSSNSRYEYHPVSGTAAEKIVIPDEITELKNDWNQYWNYSVADTVRCVVFNEYIETVPGVTGSAWNALEVVSFKGNNLKVLDSYTSSGGTTYGAFYNAGKLKHIRLPDSLKTIGDYTFYKCQSLTALYLPDGLTTIGGKVFFAGYSSHTGQGHNLKELTIPASVTTIGQTAFAGSLSDFTVTALTSAPYNSAEINTTGINGRAFCTWSDNHLFNCNTTVRALKNTGAASPYFNERATESKFKALVYLEDDMGVAEVAARAKQKADKSIIGTEFVSNSAILDQITASYGSVSTISTSFKNSEWTEDGENITNTLVFTKDGLSAELPILMKAIPKLDLQSIVDEKNVAVTNDTTADTLLASLQGLSLESYEIKAITDFYKINAIEGAIEKGSTYEGAVDGEILVPGEKGYVSAVVTVSDGSTEYDCVITLDIEPAMAEYAFASVSNSMSDWQTNTNGGYQYKATNAVEKLVIPEEITELYKDWSKGWEANVKDSVKCVVFNEHITSLPGVTGSGYWNALEVVSFKGNNLKTLDSYTNEYSVTYGAFHNAAKLKHIRLPDSVTAIGDYAFYKCQSLTALYLPDGLTTIGGKVFFAGYSSHTGQGHNLKELTIPASVTTIGQTAFAGSLSDFTVTALTSAPYNSAEINTTGINGRAFCTWSDNHLFNCNTTVRALTGSGAAQPYFNERATESKFKALVYLEDDMGVAEATARAQQKADKLGGTYFTDSDTVKAQLGASYGNVSTISGSWKNEEWTVNNSIATNTYLVSKNGVISEIEISMIKPEAVDIDSLVANVEVDNLTTADSLATAITEAVDGEYTNVTVKDFYKINAIEGAIDATDGKNEVMVEGHKGNVSAVVYMNNVSTGAEVYAVVSFDIAPVMNSFTYNSVSTESDFTIIDGQLVYYAGNAEKIIVPEGVETISANAFNDCKATIKAVILPESLTAISAALTQCYNMEVVYMGDNVTTLNNYTFDYCHALKHVRLSQSLTAIPTAAFRFTYNLFDLYIPDSVTSVANNAFLRSFVKEMTLSKNVISIGDWAFNSMNITSNDYFKGTDEEKAAVNAYITAKTNAGAPTATTLTILNSGVTYGEGAISSAVNVRAAATGAYTDVAIENMSLAEAIARVNVKADSLVNVMYGDEAAATAEIVSAYGGHGNITASWKNESWTVADGETSNVVVLTKGELTEEIAIVMEATTSFYADGASILTTDAFTANNSKQGIRFYNSYESTATDKILVKGEEYTVTEFGVILNHAGVDANTVKANTLNDDELVLGAEGVTEIKGQAGTVQTEDGKNYYTVYVKNIPQGGRAYSFQCRGYIKYLDANGAEQIIYTDSQVKSVQDVFDANATADEYVGMADWFAGN